MNGDKERGMNGENFPEKFLSVLEHPEEYGEKEIKEILSDSRAAECYDMAAAARLAMAAGLSDREMEMPDTGEEWRKFEREHLRPRSGLWRKAAAAAAAVLLVSGMSFAAVHIVRNAHRTAEEKTAVSGGEDRTGSAPETVNTSASDSVPPTPVVFENAELEDIARYVENRFGVKAVFKNEEARHLRLYLQIDSSDGVGEIADLLNHFENITAVLGENTITLE